MSCRIANHYDSNHYYQGPILINQSPPITKAISSSIRSYLYPITKAVSSSTRSYLYPITKAVSSSIRSYPYPITKAISSSIRSYPYPITKAISSSIRSYPHHINHASSVISCIHHQRPCSQRIPNDWQRKTMFLDMQSWCLLSTPNGLLWSANTDLSRKTQGQGRHL